MSEIVFEMQRCVPHDIAEAVFLLCLMNRRLSLCAAPNLFRNTEKGPSRKELNHDAQIRMHGLL